MRIGFAAQDLNSQYWLIVDYAVRERATALGLTLTTTSATTLDEQVAAIDAFVDQRVDALLVGPFAAIGLAPAIERALAANIPVIAVATEVRDCTVTCTVQSDQIKGARLAASYLVEQLDGVGEIAHLVGPSRLHDNIERADTVRQVLSQHPGIHIVFEQEGTDWRHEAAVAFTREAIERFPQLRGVCAANDTLALGVIEAIDSLGRTGQIVVTGFDATPDALIAINEGRMGATVRQSIREIAYRAVEVAQRAGRGETVPSHMLNDISLVTRTNLLDAALESVYTLPGLLQDAVERGEALARARDEVITTQQAALRELSTPLIPISDTVMVMPLIGSIDSARAEQVLQTLLEGIVTHAAHLVILDITGVLVVDTHVANALIRAAQAVKLLGAEVVLTGIRPEVAQTLVGLGISLGNIVTRSTLQSGIAYALKQR